MSEPVNHRYSFVAPGAGLYCYGDGDVALLAGTHGATVAATVVADLDAGSVTVGIDGVCAATLEALGPPLRYADGERRDWLCRLAGTGRDGEALSGFGCFTSGAGELGKLALARSLWICFGEDLAFALVAERRREKHGHGDEEVAAFVARGVPLAAVAIADPRLSSTYSADGRLVRAGLELWEEDEDEEESAARERSRALRIGGETISGGELRGGDGRLTRVAFVDWHYDGREGVGCYAIERAAGA